MTSYYQTKTARHYLSNSFCKVHDITIANVSC